MIDMFQDNEILRQLLTRETLIRLLFASVLLVGGFIMIRLTVSLVRRITSKGLSRQSRMVVDKVITYTGMSILLIIILSELGVNLTALLGAAGVVGLAIGVASQKSLGNMVSGLFLLSEKPFEVGDVVRIEDKTGIVQDVDLLSLKIRTFDNQMVRIPNETLISNMVLNITRYPLRRLDFNVSVSYGDDLDLAEETLRNVAIQNELVLDEPEPFFVLKDFGASGIDMMLGVWFLKDNYVDVKNSVFKGIYQDFQEAGLTIPFTQVTLHYPESPEAAESSGTEI